MLLICFSKYCPYLSPVPRDWFLFFHANKISKNFSYLIVQPKSKYPLKAIFQNDIELLNQFKSHDKAAFELIYRQYWQRLYDFAYLKTHDGNTAEEIVQDLFVTLWEKRETLQISNFQSYLFTSVRNRVIDYYKQKTFDELDTVDVAVAADYPLFLEELEAALHQAVAQLPDKTQEIFRLNRFEGKTARQISEHLNLPERTVEYHITQALRRLKVLLKDFLPLSFILFLDSTF